MRREHYDTVVIGGGIAAMFYARSLAEHGYKVAIAADSTSLAHEIGLSRMPLKDTRELITRNPLLQAWVRLLEGYNGVKEDRFEPVLTQLLADVFVREKGIDVLFETLPVQLLRKQASGGQAGKLEGVKLATREGLIDLGCSAVVDCSDKAVLIRELTGVRPAAPASIHTFWSLTALQEGDSALPAKFSCQLHNMNCEVRIEPSYWQNELSIMAAVSSESGAHRGELHFAAVLEQLVHEVKRREELQVGSLLHVSERSWSTPEFVVTPKAGGEVGVRESGWIGSEDGSVIGVGCWTEAGVAALNGMPLWDKGGSALKLLTEWALEAAQYHVSRFARSD